MGCLGSGLNSFLASGHCLLVLRRYEHSDLYILTFETSNGKDTLTLIPSGLNMKIHKEEREGKIVSFSSSLEASSDERSRQRQKNHQCFQKSGDRSRPWICSWIGRWESQIWANLIFLFYFHTSIVYFMNDLYLCCNHGHAFVL